MPSRESGPYVLKISKSSPVAAELDTRRTRSSGLEDRRVVYISLSERGRKAYGHHARFHREMIESLTSDLSEDEMQTLVKALMKLNQWFRSKDGQR